MRMTTENINDFIELQLLGWKQAADNYHGLRFVRRKPLKLGNFDAAVQMNPARAVSTNARVDKKSIEARPCFLCKENRPDEQISPDWVAGWQLLVNPFPILPVHFTVVNPVHTPQAEIPVEMAAMAEAAPDLVFFYNGARAGASAPDHQHVQAVLKYELPLVRLVENYHPDSIRSWICSDSFGLDLPFSFMSAIVSPDHKGLSILSKSISSFGLNHDTGLINSFMWIDAKGLLRVVIIPRRTHRPECYFVPDNRGIKVSPGAIDMAGILITTRQEDFDEITPEIVRQIYAEVAFADGLPDYILDHFQN